jgi:transcriptional regulator
MEAGRDNPWRMGQAPGDYIDDMLTKIVGISLPIERFEGRFKVSSHRTDADRLGARDGLTRECGGTAHDELAEAMTNPPQRER